MNADKANVAQLTDLQSFKQVTAPFDGIITSRRIDIGDLVTAGSTSNTTSLYSVAQADKLRVFVDVPQRIAAKMQPGVTATARLKRISRTAVSRDDRPHVTSDRSRVAHAARGSGYRQSQACSHARHVRGSDVPSGASSIAGDPGQRPVVSIIRPQVAVVGDDGTVKFHDVTIGIDQGSFVEIASGISANDKVALNISSQIADGQHVDSTEIDKMANASSPQKSNAGGVVAADAEVENINVFHEAPQIHLGYHRRSLFGRLRGWTELSRSGNDHAQRIYRRADLDPADDSQRPLRGLSISRAGGNRLMTRN